MSTTKALLAGSLSAIAEQSGISLAESFLSADYIVLFDVSGSMAQPDSRDSQRRYDVACLELARLQERLPGKIAVIGFSSFPAFAANGRPHFQMGGTDLAKALEFVEPADGTIQSFIVISDGIPDSEADTLRVAARLKARIDTVYVGPERDRTGEAFLKRLSQKAGGQHVPAYRAIELAAQIEQLLLSSEQAGH